MPQLTKLSTTAGARFSKAPSRRFEREAAHQRRDTENDTADYVVTLSERAVAACEADQAERAADSH